MSYFKDPEESQKICELRQILAKNLKSPSGVFNPPQGIWLAKAFVPNMFFLIKLKLILKTLFISRSTLPTTSERPSNSQLQLSGPTNTLGFTLNEKHFKFTANKFIHLTDKLVWVTIL